MSDFFWLWESVGVSVLPVLLLFFLWVSLFFFAVLFCFWLWESVGESVGVSVLWESVGVSVLFVCSFAKDAPDAVESHFVI